MKEYVFYPLSLSSAFLTASKKMKATKFGATKAGSHIAKVLPTAFASLIVFLIVGVWHGASWKYVAFGLWNGGVIMLSILMKPLFDGALQKLHINPNNFFWRLFQMLRTFVIVCIGYVFDVAPSFRQSIFSIKKILLNQSVSNGLIEINSLGLDKWDFALVGVGFVVLFIASVLQEKTKKSLREQLDNNYYWVRYCVLLIGIIVVLTFGIYGPGYNAADFVYAQF